LNERTLPSDSFVSSDDHSLGCEPSTFANARSVVSRGCLRNAELLRDLSRRSAGFHESRDACFTERKPNKVAPTARQAQRLRQE
jgi:hypothetical protein